MRKQNLITRALLPIFRGLLPIVPRADHERLSDLYLGQARELEEARARALAAERTLAAELTARDRRIAELEAEASKLRGDLHAERTAGAEVVLAAARAIGKLALVGDAALEARLRRIAREDGITALRAELDEMPVAEASSPEVVS